MAIETYKKISIAVIVLSIAAVVVIATITSNKNKGSSSEERKETSSPAGPMKAPEPLKGASAFPDDPIKLAAIGDTYFEQQNFAQAMIVYDKTLSLDPNDVDTHNDLGLAYLYTGKADKAIETHKKGAEVNPKYQRIWLSLGFSYLSHNNNEEGKQALEKAHALDPDSNMGKEAKRMIGLIKPN